MVSQIQHISTPSQTMTSLLFSAYQSICMQ